MGLSLCDVSERDEAPGRPMIRRVVGFDPGFASFGYAVAELDYSEGYATPFVHWDPDAIGVWKTINDRDFASAASDTARRTRELWRFINSLLEDRRPDLIAVEAVAFPQGRVQHSVISNLGRARGLVDVAGLLFNAEVVELTPSAIRSTLEVTEKGKAATQTRLEKRWPNLSSLWGPRKADVEHVADAVAVAAAVLRRRGVW